MQHALANADVPFQQVVSDAGVPRSTAYSPLFQTLITVEEGVGDEGAAPADMAADDEEEVEVRRGRPCLCQTLCFGSLQQPEHVAKSERILGMCCRLFAKITIFRPWQRRLASNMHSDENINIFNAEGMLCLDINGWLLAGLSTGAVMYAGRRHGDSV